MLAVRQLCFSYAAAKTAALDHVSLEVAQGEILGLLGPNGAGKTTLIAHLSGMLAIQSGEIDLNGRPLAVEFASNPTGIAVVPQEHAFYPYLTVEENLACFAGAGGLSGGEMKSRIVESLAFAQLERYAEVRALHLSGGLKRRLNLSIALLHRPKFLLLDEPTVGVDPQSRSFILEAVKGLAKRGCAVIYTSHYMEEVEAVASRVVILDQGRVLLQGSLNELLGLDSTRLQLAVEGGAEEQLAALLAPFGVVDRQEVGVRLTLAARNNFPAAIAAIWAAGLVVSFVHYGRSDLEQLFMSLTHRSLRN